MNYGVIVPLVGGMVVANKIATGKDPSVILSYPSFEKNDAHTIENFPDVPYYQIDEKKNKLDEKNSERVRNMKLDFVSTVCPCAGLSALNSGNRGADAPQNDWMYNTAKFVLNDIKPKVFWGENAPGLGTKSGEAVANQLYKIGKENGYSFTIVKTDTRLHGIPQRRVRTFYFFWKSETSPILNAYNREYPKLKEYLEQVNEDSLYHDVYNRKDFESNGFLKWIFSDEKLLNEFKAKSKTIAHFVRTENKWDEISNFLEENGYRKELDFINHAKHKVNIGKSYWDGTPHLTFNREYISAIQGRVFEHTIHPNNERYLSIREHMHLMGLPEDYKLANLSNTNVICQNVPVSTARDWTYEVMKFINGELRMEEKDFNIFNNHEESENLNVKTVPLF